jgi:hypothetical protein
VALGALLPGLMLATTAAKADTSFDEVMAAPDDPETNLAYAESQADKGNLLDAAAALERVLLVHPNAHSVRLFYAAVLYRLNDLAGAKRQLDQLKDVELTPEQSAERDKYEDLVEHGQSPTRISGELVAGVDVESDGLGALLNELEIFGFHKPKNGAVAIGAGDATLSQDLDENGDYQFLVSGDVYARSTFAGPNTDFYSGEVRAGIGSTELNYAWIAQGVVRDYMLFDNPYLVEYGAVGGYSYRPWTWLTLSLNGEVVGQSYHEPDFYNFTIRQLVVDGHDGVRTKDSVGAAWRINSVGTLSFDVGYEGDWATYAPFGYDSEFVDGDFHVLLGGGAYTDLSGDVRYVNYHGRDEIFLFGERREEVRSDARLALGAPLSFFWDGSTNDFRENLIVEGSASFADRTEDEPLAAFHSLGGELRLIWKFGS